MSAVLRTQVAPGIFQIEQQGISQADYEAAVAKNLANMDEGDLFDALAEAPGSVAAAFSTRDPLTIGDVVLAVGQAYACQLADIELNGPNKIRSLSMEEAGIAALLKRAHDKANARRFLAEPHDVSAFGELQG